MAPRQRECFRWFDDFEARFVECGEFDVQTEPKTYRCPKCLVPVQAIVHAMTSAPGGPLCECGRMLEVLTETGAGHTLIGSASTGDKRVVCTVCGKVYLNADLATADECRLYKRVSVDRFEGDEWDAPASIEFGSKVTGMEPSADGLVVSCEDGSQHLVGESMNGSDFPLLVEPFQAGNRESLSESTRMGRP